MRFTITHPIITHPYDPGLVSGAGIAAVASAAEAAGFSGFGFTDHPAPTQRWLEAGGHDALDPFVAMGFAAAHTTTLRLIPNIVVLPYRNPFVVAKAGATLDLLSGGRFTLAVGTGYLRSEFAALGVDHTERNELFDEALEVIEAVWTGDDVTVEGRRFSARGITAHPRPVSVPRPPIWIGGNSAAARQRVAARGDGWAPFPAPAVLARTARTPGRRDRRPPPAPRRRGSRPGVGRHHVLEPGRRRSGERRLRQRSPPGRHRRPRCAGRHLGQRGPARRQRGPRRRDDRALRRAGRRPRVTTPAGSADGRAVAEDSCVDRVDPAPAVRGEDVRPRAGPNERGAER
jgi:probable F420-dependent oxidoreductase